MFRKIGISLALVSAIATTQLPLGVVQVCSWVGMFSDYVVETGSVETSLEWTFDGLHSCEGCDFVSVQVGENEEGEKTALTESTSLKLLLGPLVMEALVVEAPPVVGKIVYEAQPPLGEVADIVTPPPRLS